MSSSVSEQQGLWVISFTNSLKVISPPSSASKTDIATYTKGLPGLYPPYYLIAFLRSIGVSMPSQSSSRKSNTCLKISTSRTEHSATMYSFGSKLMFFLVLKLDFCCPFQGVKDLSALSRQLPLPRPYWDCLPTFIKDRNQIQIKSNYVDYVSAKQEGENEGGKWGISRLEVGRKSDRNRFIGRRRKGLWITWFGVDGARVIRFGFVEEDAQTVITALVGHKQHHFTYKIALISKTFLSNPKTLQYHIFPHAGPQFYSRTPELIVINIMTRSKLALYLLLAFLFSSALALPLASVATGVITPILTFNTTQSNTTITCQTTYINNITLIPSGPGLSAGISLISFDAIMSIQLIFNTSIATVNLTTLKITVNQMNATYFKLMRFHYIVAQQSTIDLLRGCFYCGNMLNGTGYRSQNFTNLTTTLTPLSNLVFTTTISGIKITNTLGAYYQVNVKTHNVGSPNVVVQVSTEQKNILEWVCVTIIAYNKFAITNQIYYKSSAILSNSAGITNISTIASQFLTDNVMFFGISSLRLNFLLDTTHKFLLSTFNSASPTTLTTNPNLESLTLQQFFVAQLACGTVVNTETLVCSATCPDNYVADANNFCFFCNNQNGHCATCNNAGCLTCNANAPDFRQINGLVCSCKSRYYQLNGTCLACSSAITNCDTCSSSTVCTTCILPFVASSGKCVCGPGLFLVNSVCVQLMGCTSVNNITSGAYCQACSASLNFLLASNQTCICVNYTAFNSVTGKCQGICGDGKSLDNICDDGDSNNTNGCSNTCTVNPGYSCTNPADNLPSICVLIKQFQCQYKYAMKEVSTNTAVLYVTLTPDYPALYRMDFSKLITTSIPNKMIKATYSSGQLIVSITYTETIEKTKQNLTISFDDTLLAAPAIQLAIEPTGINYELAFNSMENFNNIIVVLSAILGVVSILFAITSSVLGYKLMGFEILLPIQLIYLSLSHLNQPVSALGSLYTLSFSTGYNKLDAFSYLDNFNLTPGLMVLQRDGQFISNYNFTAAPLVLTFILCFIFRLCIKQKEVKVEKIDTTNKKGKGIVKQPKKEAISIIGGNEQSKKQDEKVQVAEVHPVLQDKCQKAYNFTVDRILIVFWVALLQNTVFSFEIQMLSLDANPTFAATLNSCFAILFLIVEMMCIVFLAAKIHEKDSKIQFHSKNKVYPLYLIVAYLVNTVIVSSTFFFSPYSLYFSLAVSIIPVILVLKYKPHGPFLTLNTITAFLCQLLPIIALIIFLLSPNITGSMITIAVLVMLIFVLASEVLSVIRLISKVREEILKKKQEEANMKSQKQDVQLKSIAKQTIKQSVLNNTGEKMIDWGNRNEQEYRSIQGKASQKKIDQLDLNSDEQQQEDEDQLALLKLRLKKELLAKRAH